MIDMQTQQSTLRIVQLESIHADGTFGVALASRWRTTVCVRGKRVDLVFGCTARLIPLIQRK